MEQQKSSNFVMQLIFQFIVVVVCECVCVWRMSIFELPFFNQINVSPVNSNLPNRTLISANVSYPISSLFICGRFFYASESSTFHISFVNSSLGSLSNIKITTIFIFTRIWYVRMCVCVCLCVSLFVSLVNWSYRCTYNTVFRVCCVRIRHIRFLN